MRFCFGDNIGKEIIHERYKDFIVLVIATVIIGTIFFRGTQYSIISGKNYEEINLTDYLGYVKGYETEDLKSFKVIEDDPQIFLDFTKLQNGDNKIKCIMFELGQEIPMSSVHIYYGRDTTELSEQDSENIAGEYSKDIEVCTLKSIDGFKYLRLDVDQDFIIENVKVAYDYQLVKSNYVGYLILLIILGIVGGIFCTFNNVLYNLYLSCMKKLRTCKLIIEHNVLSILKLSFLLVVIFGVVLFLEYCINGGQGYFNPYIALIATSIVGIIIFSTIFRDQIWYHTHLYYFIICMIIGTVTILTLPATVGISADDEIHYLRTENLSWGGKDKVAAAAAASGASVYTEFIQNGNMYEHKERREWEEYLDQMDERFPIIGGIPMEVPSGNRLGITSIAYVPGAIGLIIGRAIGLSYTSTFRFGKWMNLLCYAILFSWAVKMIKGKGRILIAVIGLIPTSFFMASSYSYDWWVTSFVVFGYALFLKEISEDRPISIKYQICIMIIMIIGILPKAVYFPLILPMLFVRKEKLQDSIKQRLLVIAATVFLIGTFMLPMLIGGAGTGDSRGGSDVNSTEQIKFIIGNPIQYTKILLGFLKSYLSPDNAYWYLTYFMYYGQAQYYTVCQMVLIIVAVVDNVAGRRDVEYNLPKCKIIMTGTCFITIVLVATALYISFTAVGRDTIAGCQPRYILPVVFPFLFFSIGLKVELEDKVKRNLFLVSTDVMMFIYLYGIYLLRVKHF